MSAGDAPDDPDRLEALFEAALAVPAAERGAFLDRECSDPASRAELESLLARADRAEDFFDALRIHLEVLPSRIGPASPGDEPTESGSAAVDPPSTEGVEAPEPEDARQHGDSRRGRRVAHYEVEEQLGSGGMGVVYRARDIRLEREVALKFLPPPLGLDPAAKERFLVEARAAAALDHPNVCTVHEVGATEDGRLFIAMARYEGETLADRIARGPLPVAEATSIAARIARGLAAAHARGIVHRDVKPGNVMLTAEGDVKLLDFGLAKMADVSVTRPGRTPGTIAYMSPEQVRGDAVDEQTDLWSLGVLLYEMLTGARPFGGGDDRVVLQAILHDEPEPIEKRRPGTPARLTRIAERLLHKEPGHRPARAEELLDDLERARPSAAAPPVPSRVRSRWPALVAAVVVALVLGTLGLVLAPWSTRPSASVRDGSVAVLPFDNLSPDPDNAYFAAGIHEEILTRLARVGGIELISRTSVMRYEETEKSLPEIAEELGVSAIVEGSVQRIGDRVRVSVQLNDARADEHLWAESYDRELSDIFRIQTEVATRIVEEIRGVLTPEERTELASRSTDDMEAYAHYLRGHKLRGRYFASQEGIRAAADAYRRAVELDSTFAAAWARLVETRIWLAWYRRDFDERERARSALERLARIAPDSPDLHFARGLWLYRGEERYRDALREFELLADLWPGSVYVTKMRANLYRILGRWEEGLRTMEDVFELDPSSASAATEIAWTHLFARRHEEAERYARIAVSLEPGDPFIWGFLIWARLSRGDTAAARVAVDSARSHLGEEATASRWAWGWALYQYFTGGTEEVLELYREHPLTYTSFPDLGVAVAAAHGRNEMVRSQADTLRAWARRTLASAPAEYGEVRSQAFLHLALVEAYLGSEEEAVRLADEGVRLYPVSDNAFGGPDRVLWQAHVYTVVGRHDEAVDLLRYLLSIPANMVTVPQLRMDLRWDPLRDHPGFRALLRDQGGSTGSPGLPVPPHVVHGRAADAPALRAPASPARMRWISGPRDPGP